MPRGVDTLVGAGLGHLLDGAPALAGVALRAAGRRVVGRFGTLAGRGVRRRLLDAALVEEAARAGADVRMGVRVRGVGPWESGWRRLRVERGAGPQTTDVSARAVLLADGGRSPLSRQVRGRGVARPRVGLVTHVDAAALPGWLAGGGHAEGLVEAWLAPRWQLVITPVGDGALSLALLVEPGELRSLRVSERAGGWRAIPLVGAASSVVTDGLLLAGDAAGAVDPVVGCGISLALASAQRAASVLASALDGRGPDRAALAPYAAFHRSLQRAPRAVAALALALSRRPRVARLAATVLDGLPRLADALVASVGEAR